MRISILAMKLFGVVLFISLFLLFLGFQLGQRWGLFTALMFTIAWIVLLWQSDESDWIVFFEGAKGKGLQRLRGQDGWGLLTKVELTARRLHMAPPDLYLVQSQSSFLLSLSLGLSNEVLLISTPVLRHFSDEEIEALIASELTSLWQRRRFRYRWFHWLARSLVKLAEIVDSLLPGGRTLQLLTRTVLPISQILLKIGFWGRFEADRDEMTLSLLHNRRAYASALWKLVSLSQSHPLAIPPGSEHLFLVNPYRREEEGQVLRFHAPLAERMRRILGAESI